MHFEIKLGVTVYVKDDTCGCGRHVVEGGGVRQEPPYDSHECIERCCAKKEAKPGSLYLPMRTGDPRQHWPQYPHESC